MEGRAIFKAFLRCRFSTNLQDALPVTNARHKVLRKLWLSASDNLRSQKDSIPCPWDLTAADCSISTNFLFCGPLLVCSCAMSSAWAICNCEHVYIPHPYNKRRYLISVAYLAKISAAVEVFLHVQYVVYPLTASVFPFAVTHALQ